MNDPTYTDFREMPPVFVEALNAFQFFRRLGFAADDIFFNIVPVNGTYWIGASARDQRGQEPIIRCGEVHDVEHAKSMWKTACRLYNEATNDARRESWEASKTRAADVDLLLRMHIEGVHFPENAQ